MSDDVEDAKEEAAGDTPSGDAATESSRVGFLRRRCGATGRSTTRARSTIRPSPSRRQPMRRCGCRWSNELVERSGNFLSHLLPVDPRCTGPTRRAGAGRDTRPTFSSTPAAIPDPVPIVTHLHGGHSTEESDGFPEAWYLPQAPQHPGGYARSAPCTTRSEASSRPSTAWPGRRATPCSSTTTTSRRPPSGTTTTPWA